MRKKLLVSLTCFTVFLLLITGCGEKPEKEQAEHSTGLFAMGTYITLTAYGEDAGTALNFAKKRITELESKWSVTNENSEIYQINHSQGNSVEVSQVTADLLQFTLNIAEQTDGALDPTIYPLVEEWGFISGNYQIPSDEKLQELLQNTGYEKVSISKNRITVPEGFELDLGAVGKGYTGEILTDLLKDQGITSALLDIGGNIQLVGRKPDGNKWRLGIQDPFGEGTLGVLEAEDCAVVTSGGYERYFTGKDGKNYWHILNPDDGKSADSGLVSVTIIAKEGRLCDALSTAFFVMGPEKSEKYWREHGGFDMLLVTEDNEIIVTDGIADSFVLNDGRNETLRVLEQ